MSIRIFRTLVLLLFLGMFLGNTIAGIEHHDTFYLLEGFLFLYVFDQTVDFYNRKNKK